MDGRTTVVPDTERADDLPGIAGALIVTGLGVGAALAAAYMTQATRRRPTHADQRQALAAYLREHLSGSDVAVQVVERLRRTQAGTEEGRLFAELFEQFEEDRGVVRDLLARMGLSSRSVKRLAGQASGSLLSMTAGGAPGDLSLFRTVELLAIGVQGKRLMWRALQCLGPDFKAPGRRSLTELEAAAVRQWEAIEACRQILAARTFPAFGTSVRP